VARGGGEPRRGARREPRAARPPRVPGEQREERREEGEVEPGGEVGVPGVGAPRGARRHGGRPPDATRGPPRRRRAGTTRRWRGAEGFTEASRSRDRRFYQPSRAR
jgi:hypothetical protein